MKTTLHFLSCFTDLRVERVWDTKCRGWSVRIRGVRSLCRKVSVDFVHNKERRPTGGCAAREEVPWIVQRSGLPWGTWSLAGRGAPGHQCSRERIRGRRGDQGQEAQFLCIAVLREGGSLISLARGRYPNRAGQIKEKEDQQVFQTLALPVFC